MGTPAIIVVNDCGVYRTCVCGGDGYLDHTGDRLRKDYSDRDDALELVSQGDFRGFYDELEHYKEANTKPRAYSTLQGVLRGYEYCNLVYLYEDSIWSLVDLDSRRRLYWYQLEDYVTLTCSICEFVETINTETGDHGGWVSEVYFGKQALGQCCPKCQKQFTRVTDEGECEVVLTKVTFPECPGLISIIEALV